MVSLQEQLLKAGLVDKNKVKQANQDKSKQKKVEHRTGTTTQYRRRHQERLPMERKLYIFGVDGRGLGGGGFLPHHTFESALTGTCIGRPVDYTRYTSATADDGYKHVDTHALKIHGIMLTKFVKMPGPYQLAAKAALDDIQKTKRKGTEYFVDAPSENDGLIELPLWHISAFSKENEDVIGNPGGLCYSVIYDPKKGRIVQRLMWQ